MSDELTSLILLDENTTITVRKPGVALPAAQKKEVDKLHLPAVSGSGFTRLFPNFYVMNGADKVDPKTKKKVVSAETFTRNIQLPGQERTELFTTESILFVPLAFKHPRQYYEIQYDENNLAPPDCQSNNGIVPQNNIYANSCEECDLSKWVDKTPPACGEMREILAVDMTSMQIKDEVMKQAATKEAFTILLKKSSIKAVTKLMRELNEPVLFDDGTYGPVDMTQFLVKMTSQKVYDAKGAAKNYCEPVFEIMGQVPFEVSEQLLGMLNQVIPGGKTVHEAFIGRTEPFTGEPTGPAEKAADPGKVKKQAGPPVASGAKMSNMDKAVSRPPVERVSEAAEVTVTVEVPVAVVVVPEVKPEPVIKAAPQPVGSEDSDEVIF